MHKQIISVSRTDTVGISNQYFELYFWLLWAKFYFSFINLWFSFLFLFLIVSGKMNIFLILFRWLFLIECFWTSEFFFLSFFLCLIWPANISFFKVFYIFWEKNVTAFYVTYGDLCIIRKSFYILCLFALLIKKIKIN